MRVKKSELVPVDYKAAQLPSPEEVMERPPPTIRNGKPAIRDSKAMDEYYWWRYWAIGQTAWVGQGGRRELKVAMDCQAKMREITALRARFDAVHPTVEVSRPRRVGPYQERQTEREKEILAYFKNNTYRKRDGDEQAIVISEGSGESVDGGGSGTGIVRAAGEPVADRGTGKDGG